MARRSTDVDGSSVGAPCTWQRNPSLAYSSAREMPDLASCRVERTSWVLLPMDETMPIPVTTTRLMAAYPHSRRGLSFDWTIHGPPQAAMQHCRFHSRAARLQRFVLFEQADLEAGGLVDHVA